MANPPEKSFLDDPGDKVLSLLDDSGEKVFSLLDEFKNFALKGNVVDLAVGVIIGGAFGKIVDSLVKDVIMPLISLVTPGKAAYEDWTFHWGEKIVPYGKFLAEIVNFLILAAALYLFIVKFLGFILDTKLKEEAAPPAPPTKEEVLLTEIRDLLKASQTHARASSQGNMQEVPPPQAV